MQEVVGKVDEVDEEAVVPVVAVDVVMQEVELVVVVDMVLVNMDVVEEEVDVVVVDMVVEEVELLVVFDVVVIVLDAIVVVMILDYGLLLCQM